MSKNYIAGIDPGSHGAICLYNKDLPPIIFDMPTLEIKRNGKKRTQIDLYALAKFIDLHSKDIIKAYIENPQGMPGMASNSTYRLGLNVGIAQMAIASAFIPMQLLAPHAWKKDVGVTKDKDSCRLKASQISPLNSHHWARAKDDGRAESFLIAWYGTNKIV